MHALAKTLAFVSNFSFSPQKERLKRQLLMFWFMNGTPGYCILQFNRSCSELNNFVMTDFPEYSFLLEWT